MDTDSAPLVTAVVEESVSKLCMYELSVISGGSCSEPFYCKALESPAKVLCSIRAVADICQVTCGCPNGPQSKLHNHVNMYLFSFPKPNFSYISQPAALVSNLSLGTFQVGARPALFLTLLTLKLAARLVKTCRDADLMSFQPPKRNVISTPTPVQQLEFTGTTHSA